MTVHAKKSAAIETARWRARVRTYAFAYVFYFTSEGVGAVA